MVLQIEDILIKTIDILRELGPIIIFLVIVIESIMPIIPVGVFITLNIIILGPVLGFIISWIATNLGCILSFYICRKGFSSYLYRKVKDRPKFNQIMDNISNMKLSHMVLYVAVPFTPAFMFNFACGLTKVPFQRFLIAILVGKISLIYFWGYIGTSLIESIKNPLILLEVIITVLLAYMVSLLVQKLID
jgi:uncharacterized membrane protein YdjX (TVP38/TMEM64 family)